MMLKEAKVEIKAIAGDVTQVKTGALVLGLFKGEEKLGGDLANIDKALDGGISQLITQGEVKGKPGEITVVHSLGKLPAAKVVVVGLGQRNELNRDKARGAVAETARCLQRREVDDVAIAPFDVAGVTPEVFGQLVAEGVLLGIYSFRKHITKEAEYGEIKELSIISPSKAGVSLLQRGIDRGRILAEATNLARDMVNEPSNLMTPMVMAGMTVPQVNLLYVG
jgi:leucyl aminopeptidase